MPTLTHSSPVYAYGGPWESPDWNVPAGAASLGSNGVFSYIWFEDEEFADMGSVSSATLTIYGFGAPGTDEVVRIKGDKSSGSPMLPVDLNDAQTRSPLTSASESKNVNGLASWPFDVTAIYSEINGAVGAITALHFLMENIDYHGSGMTGLTAVLSIEYSLGEEAFIEVDQPEGIIEIEAAEMSAEVHVNATQPEAVIELEAATMSAITPVLVSQAEAVIELEASTPTAAVNLAVTMPEAVIELECAVMEAETSVVATLPEAFIELEAASMTAIMAVVATLPEAFIELEAASMTAIMAVLASQPEALIEIEAASMTGRPNIAVSAPEAVIELEAGRLWAPAAWKTVKATQIKASAVTAK